MGNILLALQRRIENAQRNDEKTYLLKEVYNHIAKEHARRNVLLAEIALELCQAEHKEADSEVRRGLQRANDIVQSKIALG